MEQRDKQHHVVVESQEMEKEEEVKPQKTKRVASLDIFRGLTVALMILVDDAGGEWPMIGHAPWNGCNLADFVMPFFLFIVGMAIALALKVTCNVRGNLNPPCNAVGYIDRRVLGINHLYPRPAWKRSKVDILNLKYLFLPLEWIGMNAMLVYVMAAGGIFAGFINGWYYEDPHNTLDETFVRLLFRMNKIYTNCSSSSSSSLKYLFERQHSILALNFKNFELQHLILEFHR
ncbi:hypothetical protein RND71_041136 [Anisodus tanguticus]|uniref:Heparan-alpha-glucosaminide N-acetyltransferase n=1 Tax=Anisodus tanguticus TaxID=243964 RepID=A0AAE1QTJ7_9SOLA|nr:hypothetical protein RND71_041136 [Anisodus tanguticus]